MGRQHIPESVGRRWCDEGLMEENTPTTVATLLVLYRTRFQAFAATDRTDRVVRSLAVSAPLRFYLHPWWHTPTTLPGREVQFYCIFNYGTFARVTALNIHSVGSFTPYNGSTPGPPAATPSLTATAADSAACLFTATPSSRPFDTPVN